MPTRPEVKTLTNTSVDVLNAIRNSASINYRDYVPYATPDAESIREIGAIIMDYPALQNEFLNALINRIGKVILTSKMYSNPWERFKKGVLEFGETIEDIFVDIAKPFQYDTAVAETEVFKREKPDVKSAFYVMNYQKFYKTTIQQEQLRLAFLSWTGITDLISKIVDSMYSAANYDEYLVMKYMMCNHVLNHNIANYRVSNLTSNDGAKSIVTKMKSASNELTFMKRKYNTAGVANFTPKTSQYLITSSEIDALIDVEVLAAAFNMDKAEFSGHRILIDSFTDFDWERLDILFEGVDSYHHWSPSENSRLQSIAGIIVDEDWFMIFDNMYNFTENFNGQGLYWNYFYHVWKTFAISPFANAVLFTTTNSSVTGVTITPATANVLAGSSLQLTATVTVSGFAGKDVNWTVNEIEGVSIDSRGILTVGADVPAETEITVTATSVDTPNRTATATITVVTE